MGYPIGAQGVPSAIFGECRFGPSILAPFWEGSGKVLVGVLEDFGMVLEGFRRIVGGF